MSNRCKYYIDGVLVGKLLSRQEYYRFIHHIRRGMDTRAAFEYAKVKYSKCKYYFHDTLVAQMLERNQYRVFCFCVKRRGWSIKQAYEYAKRGVYPHHATKYYIDGKPAREYFDKNSDYTIYTREKRKGATDAEAMEHVRQVQAKRAEHWRKYQQWKEEYHAGKQENV